MSHLLEMDGWASGFRFSACHLIPGHEKCGRLHGHSYAVHIRVHGTPNKDHIIADFGEIKAVIREVCEELDHKMLVPTKNSQLKVTKKGNNIVVTHGKKTYSFPTEDVLTLPIPSATAEGLARYILDRISPKLKGPNIKKIEIGLDEGIGQGAWAQNTY
jgi:6-pyruvoyltetrahydropterin/6-carboxytetrahydropterin synthase